MRYSIKKLNTGDASMMLKLASDDFALAFPGNNSWSTMFRPHAIQRERHETHRGITEGRAFADRFTEQGVQFTIEDILVNGPPWNTRIALRVQSFIPASEGGGPDEYNNRAIALLEVKWGRLVKWEDYEDTERVAAWDARRGVTSPSAKPSQPSPDPVSQ
jgi:ketosteroid isomerase-like protein